MIGNMLAAEAQGIVLAGYLIFFLRLAKGGRCEGREREKEYRGDGVLRFRQHEISSRCIGVLALA